MDVLDLLLLQDSDGTSGSEDEEDLELLWVELSFLPKSDLEPRFNFEECSEVEYERLFR